MRSSIRKKSNYFSRNRAKIQVLLLLCVMAAYIGIMSALPSNFFQSRNILNILTQVTPLGIAAAGSAIVMIGGGIDLSIGNMLSLCGCVCASLMMYGIDMWICIALCLMVGVGCGALNGTLIVLSKSEPFIITLGTMSLYKGLSLLVSGGMNLDVYEGFSFGRDKIADIFPVPVICLCAVFIAVFLILRFTIFGRRVYAIGNNAEAAFVSGIKVKRNRIYHYTICGGLLGFASMILTSRLSSANSLMGDELLMEAIAATVIGGVSMSGGRGSVWGVFLGAILIGIVSNSLNLLSVAPFYQHIILAVIIVGAVFVSNLGSKSG